MPKGLFIDICLFSSRISSTVCEGLRHLLCHSQSKSTKTLSVNTLKKGGTRGQPLYGLALRCILQFEILIELYYAIQLGRITLVVYFMRQTLTSSSSL